MCNGHQESCLKKQIHKLAIVCLTTEVPFQHLKYKHFYEERIIDSYFLDILVLVPAWLSTARLAIVHDIICHQQPCLHPFDGPAKHGEAADFLGSQSLAIMLC